MKNQGTREQIQCPSCGRWNNYDEVMCGGCGRIIQVQEKPPVDYSRWTWVIILAVVALGAVSFRGYLKFAVSDAEKKIAAQDYETAAKELMRISFWSEKAEEMLYLPELEENCALVAYTHAKNLYRRENYLGAITKLVPIQAYEDSAELLRKYTEEFLEGYWLYEESKEWGKSNEQGVVFSISAGAEFSMRLWGNTDNDSYDMSICDMSFSLEGRDPVIDMQVEDGIDTYFLHLTNFAEDSFILNDERFIED